MADTSVTEAVSLVRKSRVPSDEIRDEQLTPETLYQVLNDEEVREGLLFAAKEYREILGTLVEDYFRIIKYRRVTYLIDFDVLTEYLGLSTPATRSSFYATSVLKKCVARYAIPSGAFLELLDYIADFAGKTDGLQHSFGTADRTQVVRILAHTLGIQEHLTLTGGATATSLLIKKIIERLDTSELALQRLCDLLSDPRFDGVISDYDMPTAERLRKILSQFERHDSKSRERRDARDAVNIAIALKPLRDAYQIKDGTVEGYILVSSTRALVHLPDLAAQSGEGAKLLETLCSIIQQSPSVVKRMFPVLTPSRVVHAEALGVLGDPNQQINQVLAIDQSIGNLIHLLQKMIVESKMRNWPQGTTHSGEDYETLKKLVELISSQLQTAKAGLFELEAERSTAASVEYSRLQQTGKEISYESLMRQRSTALLKTFGKVLNAFHQIPGYEYRLRATDLTSSTFLPFAVVQLPGTEELPLVFGEEYRLDAHEEARKYFSIRWPVYCPAKKFINTIEHMILRKLPRKRLINDDGDPKLVSVEEDSVLWSEGVLIYTNIGLFGMPIDSLLRRNGWSYLYLERLPTLLRSSCSLTQTAEEQISIELYRINTMYGDFLLDVVPSEPDNRRYLTVISHYNLASQISLLYKRTGIHFVLLSKLSATLHEKLREFETLP